MSCDRFFKAKPLDSSVASGAQVQQLINIVCVQEFTKMLVMEVKFVYT